MCIRFTEIRAISRIRTPSFRNGSLTTLPVEIPFVIFRLAQGLETASVSFLAYIAFKICDRNRIWKIRWRIFFLIYLFIFFLCVAGQKLAIQSIKVIVANIIKSYKIKAVEREDNLNLVAEIVLNNENGIKIAIEKR